MENSILIESEIKIGENTYEIIKYSQLNNDNQLSIDDIINNVTILRETSDKYLQKIIDENKFLLKDNKIKQIELDENIVEDINPEDEN